MMKRTSSILMIVLSAWLFQACHSRSKRGAEKNITGQTIMVSEDDSRFAVEAFGAGVDEVELSSVASKKLVDKKLKDFAARMVSDHAKANNELLGIAKSKNVILSFALTGDGQQAEDDLNQKTGSDFDKAYVTQMIDDHEKAVKLFEDAVSDVSDPDIKAFAAKTLPVIKKHLDAIKAIHNSMK
jgi:putative membrane protein